MGFSTNFQGIDQRWDVEVQLSGEQVGRTIVQLSEVGAVILRAFHLDNFWHKLEQMYDRRRSSIGSVSFKIYSALKPA